MTSRIKIPRSFEFDPSRLDFYFPIIGLFPAILGWAVYYLASPLSPGGFLPAVLALAVQYFGFNLFHLDGLMDTADAFLGTVNREKRLAILKDSRVGVYGFFTGFVALALKLAILWELRPALRGEFGIIIFLAYPIAGRICAAIIPGITPPQNETGLGSLVKDVTIRRVFIGGVLSLACWTALVYGVYELSQVLWAASPAALLPGMIPPAAIPLLVFGIPLLSSLVSVTLARLYRKGIGGYTGDALGAAVELGEIAHLMIFFVIYQCFELLV